MFISKSKKGLKPKAPARRGAQAQGQTNDDAIRTTTPRESAPGTKSNEAATVAQTGKETEDHVVLAEQTTSSNGASTVSQEKELELENVAARPEGEASTLRANDAVPTSNNESLGRTRSTRSGRSNTPTAHSETQTREVTETTAKTAHPTVQRLPAISESQAPPTTPSTQPVVGSYIRKSKKVIQPKARTRRTEAEEPLQSHPQERAPTDQVDLPTPRANDTGTSDDVDDISGRLLSALTAHASTGETTHEESQDRADDGQLAASQLNDSVAFDPMQIQNIISRPGEPAGATKTTTARTNRKRTRPGTENQDEESTAAKKQKKTTTRKPRAKKASVSQQEGAADSPVNVASGDEAPVQKKLQSRKRKRAATPGDGEIHQIATDEVRMGDLVADSHQGQTSIREQRLKARDAEEKERKVKIAQERAREQFQEIMEDPENSMLANGADGGSTTVITRRNAASPPVPTRSASPEAVAMAPQFRIVNGQIVADESSRVVDRRVERTRAAQMDDTASVIEEDDLSRRINSRSFTKYDRPTRWDESSTALFHRGLQYFGLEFSMMACLFPGRSRRQLKAKFIREERADVHFVNSLLKDRLPYPTVSELEEIMGKKLRSPEELNQELREQQERLEAAQRAEDAMYEEHRKRREREAEEQNARVRRRPGEPGSSDEDDEEEENEQQEDEDEEEEEQQDESRPANHVKTRSKTRTEPVPESDPEAEQENDENEEDEGDIEEDEAEAEAEEEGEYE